MAKSTSPNRRLLITKNLILMLVMLVIIALAVFAWYSNVTQTTASETVLSAGDSDLMEIAVPEKKLNTSTGKYEDSFPVSNDSWKPEIEFESSGYLKNLIKDVTSNGSQFVLPNFEAASGLKNGRRVIPDDVWTEAFSSKEALTNDKANDDDQYYYISLDFYLRAKSPNINIKETSFLAAGSELGYNGTTTNSENKRFLKGNSIYRCSSYGAAEGTANAFSSDAIVGAMRVSLVGTAVDSYSTANGISTETSYNGVTPTGGNTIKDVWKEQATTKLLWLPRPDLFLRTDNNSDNWTLKTGIKPNDSENFDGSTIASKTYCHTFYKGLTVGQGNAKVNKGLEQYTFYDENVYTPSNSGETNVQNPDFFMVSKVENSTNTSVLGWYPTLGRSKQIASGATSTSIQFTPSEDTSDTRATTGYYVYKFNLNIWIEGEDAEARRSMNNGVFSLHLDFGS